MNFQAFGQAVKDKCNTVIRGSSTVKNGAYPSIYSSNTTAQETADQSTDFYPEKKRVSYQSKVALEEQQREMQQASHEAQGYAHMSMDPSAQAYASQQPQPFHQPMPTQQQPYGQQPFGQAVPQQPSYAQPPMNQGAYRPQKPAPACMHYVFHLYSREQCKDVIPYIRYNVSVVINLEYITSPQEQQRCLDILCGAAYALNCTITNVLRSIVFMITPANILVDVIKWDKQRSTAEYPQPQNRQPVFQTPQAVPPVPQMPMAEPVAPVSPFQPARADYTDTVRSEGVYYGSGTPSERFQRQRRPEGV